MMEDEFRRAQEEKDKKKLLDRCIGKEKSSGVLSKK